MEFVSFYYSRHLVYGSQVKTKGGGKGPFPQPFPEGKGAGRLMGVTVFRGSVSVEEGLASPLQGRRERGFIVESRHADQEHRHESKSHQSKTSTCKGTAA